MDSNYNFIIPLLIFACHKSNNGLGRIVGGVSRALYFLNDGGQVLMRIFCFWCEPTKSNMHTTKLKKCNRKTQRDVKNVEKFLFLLANFCGVFFLYILVKSK